MEEHDVIYLQPRDEVDGTEGRLWCPDSIWSDHGIKYIRADLVVLKSPDVQEEK